MGDTGPKGEPGLRKGSKVDYVPDDTFKGFPGMRGMRGNRGDFGDKGITGDLGPTVSVPQLLALNYIPTYF